MKDEEVIRCICGVLREEGDMLMCDKCEVIILCLLPRLMLANLIEMVECNSSVSKRLNACNASWIFCV